MGQAIRSHPVVAYFVMVYALAWLIWVPVGILTGGVPLTFVLLGAWTPTITAFVLTGYLNGKNGLRVLLGRILIWRVAIQWYAFIIFSAAIIGLIANFLWVILGGTAPEPTFPEGVPRELGYVVLPIILLTNIFVGGPIGEEFGWRGFALAHLQKGMGALQASQIIGFAWGMWHLPFFVFPGTSSIVGGIPGWGFVLLTIAWSILFTWVYNHTNGSILLMVLYHAALNTTIGSLGLIGTSSEGMTLLILYIILTWLVAFLVVSIYGPRHLTRRLGAQAAK